MASTKDASCGRGLVALLLITRTRPGPRLVFHYPEDPDYKPKPVCTADSESESDDDDEEQSSSVVVPSVVPDEAKQNLDCAPKRPGQRVLGRSVESLEKVLSPGRWSHGKRFEINLDGLTFLGHPIHAQDDDEWSLEKSELLSKSTSKDAADIGEGSPASLDVTSPKPPGRMHDFAHVADSFESQNDTAFGTSTQTASSTGSDLTTDGKMAMFHVVFVLRETGAQAQIEARAMYQDVAKKLSRALHHCQNMSNYVTAQKALALKTKAKQSDAKPFGLWMELAKNSELAWALKETFERLTQGEVAGLRLDGMELSLCLGDIKQTQKHPPKLDPLSAVLLLDSKESLLCELSHPDASPLETFIREHTPTKSLQKHSVYVGMPVEDVLYLASHLIKWRKARLISPLNQWRTYVVTHDAPVNDIQHHTAEYHKLFPTLPLLPNMLKVLSGKPIRYGLLIPSRDHRTAYMDILSYLVRHHFVAQLKTFGWLRLPKALLDRSKSMKEVSKRQAVRSSLFSPRARPTDDDVASVSSERTTIAPSTPVSRATRRTSHETQISQTGEGKGDDVHVIITNPRECNEEQRKLIEALKTCVQDSNLAEILPRLILHLDGKSPFEDIAAREGWKRAHVEDCLADIDKYLITVRHVQ